MATGLQLRGKQCRRACRTHLFSSPFAPLSGIAQARNAIMLPLAETRLEAPVTEEALAKIDTTVAHPARIYDYCLGGKDNFAADRAAGDEFVKIMPDILPAVLEARAFLVRVARFLAGEAGIRQFL